MDALKIALRRVESYGSREVAADTIRQEIANLRRQHDPAGRIPGLEEVLSYLSGGFAACLSNPPWPTEAGYQQVQQPDGSLVWQYTEGEK